MISIVATAERAIAAHPGATDNRDGAAGASRRTTPLVSYTSRRNPKQFALAEVKTNVIV